MSTKRALPRQSSASSHPLARVAGLPRRRVRLRSDDRRRELLRAAGSLLTAHGADGVQFPDVAAAAGVTRQLVYKFFPNRQALVMAVLEDFATDLMHRFATDAARGIPGELSEVTRRFVDAVCDTIAAKGAGPWRLLDPRGADAEAARFAQTMEERLLEPWYPSIARRTGASEREVMTLARMIVAAARAVLDLWSNGTLTREQAATDATRGISALLAAFTTTTP